MHYLYVLYSFKVDKFYVGKSPDVLEIQNLHNSHHFRNSFTKIANDWEIQLTFKCEQRGDAIYLEKFIKRMKILTNFPQVWVLFAKLVVKTRRSS